MSDPTLEEESLISQDDIDKLLDASSLEEAEEKLDAPQDAEDPAMDEIGELSQDDIDNLLTGSDDDPLESEADDAGELSQDDIDSLMGSGDAEDDVGELSQDDIDSLMGGSPEEEEAGELSQDDIDGLLGGGDDGDDEDMELISQDDIDSLMNASQDASEDDEDDELISMDDIQDMIGGEDPEAESDPDDAVAEETPAEPVENEVSEPEEAPAAVSPEPEEGSSAQDPYDVVIGDADAMAVADCLVTQETMDDLIRNAPAPEAEVAEPAPEPDLPQAEPEPDFLAEDDMDSPIDLGAEGPVNLDASDDDLDNLLDEAGDDLDLDLGGEPDGDVTQEDIDALLQESDDGDDFLDEDDDILISQDDIDTLLMAADQEDEDVLGDLLGDDVDDSMDDFDEQEIVSGRAEEEDDIDQVVLEGDEEEEDTESGETGERAEKIKALLKSKLVLAAASILLVLGISVPAAYFLFFSEKPVALPGKESVPVAAQVTRDVEVASVTIEDEMQVPVLKQSGTIVLTDFVILASDLTADMTYVYADISIDYSDQRAYHEISSNLSFYRDLIYEAIQTSLVSEKRNEVTESDLLWGVETSLKKVLPPHFIEKISFKTFRTT